MVKGKRKKLQGAALRSKKRQKEHLQELQEDQADTAASQAIFDKPNEQLFVLDGQQHVGGDKQQQQSVRIIQAATDADVAIQKKKLDMNKKKNQMSELDRTKIEKLVSKHSAKELQAMAEAGRKSMQKRQEQDFKNQGVFRKGRLHKDFREAQNYDLWGNDSSSCKKPDEETKKKSDVSTPGIGSALAGIHPAANIIKAKTTMATAVTNTTTTAAAAKNAVAGIAPPVVDTVHAAGQSYRPEPNAHSKLLKQAVDIELRRNQAEKYLKTPISQGLSEETKAYMVMDSSSDESSSSDEEEEKEEGNNKNDKKVAGVVVRPVLRTDKLTRAQRNKKKRTRSAVKAEEASHKERKRMRHEFAQLPKFAKDLKKQELLEAEKRREAKELQEKKRRTTSKTEWATLMSQRHALSAPTLPVALPSELQKKEPPTPSSLSTTTDKKTAAASTTTSSSSTLRTLKPKGSLVSMTTDRMLLQYNGGLGKKEHERKRDKNQRKRRRVAVQNKGTSGADFAVLG